MNVTRTDPGGHTEVVASYEGISEYVANKFTLTYAVQEATAAGGSTRPTFGLRDGQKVLTIPVWDCDGQTISVYGQEWENSP